MIDNIKLKTRNSKLFGIALAIFVLAVIAAFAFFEGSRKAESAGTNIDSTNHYAWNDVIGWIDFNQNGNGNVSVASNSLKGWASSSAGVFSLNCQNTPPSNNICSTSNYNVINDGNGNLSGWAWNDMFGWISFCGGAGTAACPGNVNYQVVIDGNGDFNGAAWNDVIGPICFNSASCPSSNPPVAYKVSTTWRNAPVYATATLDSVVIDTGSSGAQLNSIIFHGALNGGNVGFQVATSTSPSGPWIFDGPNGVQDISNLANDWTVNAANPDAAIKVGYGIKDFRYIKYRMYLQSSAGGAASPRVDQVILNWSP